MAGMMGEAALAREALSGGFPARALFAVIDRDKTFAHADYLSMTMRNARSIEQAVLASGITATQFRILYRLITHHGAMRVGSLADALDMGASSVCGALAQLDAAGAVTRADDRRDRRGVCALITAYGRELERRTERALRPVMEGIYAEFPVDLKRYIAVCTLRVARSNALFGEDDERFRSVESALCDEILLTSALVNRITHDEGLSLTEYRVMLDLLPRTNGARPNEVARSLGLKRNGIASAQAELLRRGFIARERDALDRRAVTIDLTSDGYAVLRRAALALDEALVFDIMPDFTSNDFEKHQRLAETVQALHR